MCVCVCVCVCAWMVYKLVEYICRGHWTDLASTQDSAQSRPKGQIAQERDLKHLKHKDSFGKSENLSKIFFAEILVFDHDYEGKSSSSNGLLWISYFV